MLPKIPLSHQDHNERDKGDVADGKEEEEKGLLGDVQGGQTVPSASDLEASDASSLLDRCQASSTARQPIRDNSPG